MPFTFEVMNGVMNLNQKSVSFSDILVSHIADRKVNHCQTRTIRNGPLCS